MTKWIFQKTSRDQQGERLFHNIWISTYLDLWIPFKIDAHSRHHFTISTFWAVWCLRLLQLGNIAKIRLRLPRSVWQSSVLSRSSTYFPVFSILMWQTSIKWIIKSMQIMTKTYLNIRTLKIKQIETSEILSYSNFLRIMREWVRLYLSCNNLCIFGIHLLFYLSFSYE